MNDCAERLTTAERLLTREQIAAIGDIEWLEDELDRVSAAGKQIEVDLEFRSDDFATDGWEHRARKALAAHHICQGHLTRRIHSIRHDGKSKGPTPVELQDAKARKQAAHAARLAAQTEAARAKALTEKNRAFAAMIAFADRQNFLARFYAAAKRAIPREGFEALVIAANEALASSLSQAAAQAGVTPTGAETTGSVGEADSTRSSQEDAPTPSPKAPSHD